MRARLCRYDRMGGEDRIDHILSLNSGGRRTIGSVMLTKVVGHSFGGGLRSGVCQSLFGMSACVVCCVSAQRLGKQSNLPKIFQTCPRLLGQQEDASLKILNTAKR